MESLLPFSLNLKLLSANSFNLEGFEICCLGKGNFFINSVFYYKPWREILLQKMTLSPLFSECFQKPFFLMFPWSGKKNGIVKDISFKCLCTLIEMITISSPLPHSPDFYHPSEGNLLKTLWGNKNQHFLHFKTMFYTPHRFNPFPHNDAFWRPWETSLLKTLWEKEKLLVTSNFSFSHNVFYLFG